MYNGERLNSISHLVGAVLALMGSGALLTVAIQSRDPWIVASFSAFGASLVLLYTMSTLYHSFRSSRLKRLFKLFDHVSIYLLIAGTYTPFMLVTLRDGNGWLILSLVWALAGAGILSELFLSGRAVKTGQTTDLPGHGLVMRLRPRGPAGIPAARGPELAARAGGSPIRAAWCSTCWTRPACWITPTESGTCSCCWAAPATLLR